MNYDWILDVLTDLKAFATANGLKALAEQLDDTCLVAATEIAQDAETPGGDIRTNEKTARGLHRPAAGHRNT
ncbi:MAG: hypothetical protein H6895_00860 [Defluviimonas sp.]|nr:hypothetical protein [Paracoccaceae bacterium]MCC0062633.1 hypothetical protein [Defluviimonas sp.]